MLIQFFKKFTVLGMAIALVSCTSPPPSIQTLETENPANADNQTLITIGDISNNPTKKIKRYQPMADYLASQLSESGTALGEVKIAPDLETMAEWLKSAQVDIFFDSPYPAMLVSEQSGAQPILRRWKDGVGDYYTVIFAQADSGIASVSDLQGHLIAFDEISSTSGYVLPLAYLLNANLKLTAKSSATENIAGDEVGYIFSDDDENTIQWVISGKVDAGAVDIGTYMEMPEESRDQMIILGETEKVARHVVMIRPGMEPQELEKIKTILIEMDQTAEGKEVLQKFEKTAKFDNFPTQEDIAKMRQLSEKVRNR